MKRLILLVFVAALALPAIARGQTVVDPSALQLSELATYKVRFDHDGKDVTNFKVCTKKGGSGEQCGTPLLPDVVIGTTSTREMPFPAAGVLTVGAYTLNVYAIGPGGTSAPLALPITVMAPVPVTPTGVVIIKVTTLAPDGTTTSEIVLTVPSGGVVTVK